MITSLRRHLASFQYLTFTLFLCILQRTSSPLLTPTLAQNPSSGPCTWNGYDLSALYDSAASQTNGPNTYEMRVCAQLPVLAGSCNSIGNGASVCATTSEPGGAIVQTVLGYWPTSNLAQWAFIDLNNAGAGIQYSLNGEITCASASGGGIVPYQTVVQFSCSPDGQGQPGLQLDGTGCIATWVWPVSQSCTPTGPSKPPTTDGGDDDGEDLSDGAIAGIVVSIVVVFLMVAAVCWWMHENGKLEDLKGAFDKRPKQGKMNEKLLPK